MYIYKREFHSTAYFVALILMAMSLPLSNFVMSVMQFTLLGLWLWAGFSFEKTFDFFKEINFFKGLINFLNYVIILGYNNIIDKFRIFFKNKPALVLTSLFFLHVIGLIYTSDFSYAFKDLRTKLPLFAFPVILSTMEPLNKKRFNWVMLMFVGAVLIGTFISTHVLMEQE